MGEFIIAPNECRVVALIFPVFYSELRLLWQLSPTSHVVYLDSA